MCVPLVAFLSTVVLHSVSAGGVYCAKTARARAAALGLDYPGIHGAPDLYGPAHHELSETEPYMAFYRQPAEGSLHDGIHKQANLRSWHGTYSPVQTRAAALGLDYPGVHGAPDLYGPAHHELSETEPYMASYRQPVEGSLQTQANPRSWHGTYSPVQSEYTADQVLSLPRGRPVINRESNFEEVKHVAPPTQAEARGQPDLVNWDPQGRNEPLSFVYNEHDLVVDESVPNRRGMSLSGLPVPQSRGHGAYQRGLTGVGREVPVLGSSGITDEDRVRGMTSRVPSVGRLKRIRFPGHHAQPMHRRLNVKQFFQGNPVLRQKSKSSYNKSVG